MVVAQPLCFETGFSFILKSNSALVERQDDQLIKGTGFIYGVRPLVTCSINNGL